MIVRVRVHAEGFLLIDATDEDRAIRVAAQVFEEGGVAWTWTLWEVVDEPVVLEDGMRYWTDDEVTGDDDADLPE